MTAALLAAAVLLFIGATSALSQAIRIHLAALAALLASAVRLFLIAVIALVLLIGALLSGNDAGQSEPPPAPTESAPPTVD